MRELLTLEFLISLSFLLLMSFILSCGKDNPTAPDTQPPSVSIDFPFNGETVSNKVNVKVIATDNETIAKVELYISGNWVSSSPYSIVGYTYIFEVDFGKYARGKYGVRATAYDLAGNVGTSDNIIVNVLPDFAPDGNGYIRVEILYYQETASLDGGIGSWGDPNFYLRIKLDNDNEPLILTQTSGYFLDRYELWNPYYYDFNVPDDTEKFSLTISVWDEDDFSDDDLAGSFTSTFSTSSLPIEKEDKSYYCKLKVRVSTVTRQEVAAGRR